ncbi:hypothetical protein JG688_00002909 [Phytophthora aleatoria]|uniref:NADP-dependent oxidoreductase domain-containing protein n=1 Tax=Phytophthora aleatoria TaxID=2496075 RepID=A0A8J5M8D4_9STRA|nr:hypothetical protein JG688_00002909 [Phytophthora aleatoria]
MSVSAPAKMTYRFLGNSGLLVSKISLGAWMIWDDRCSDEGCLKRLLVALFKKYKLGLTTYSPLAYGVLSGKYTKDIPEGSRFSTELYNNIVPDFRDRVVKTFELQKIADKLGCSLAQMAIAWCVSNPNASTVMLGARTRKQLDENLEAIRFVEKITPEIKARIDAAVDYKVQIPEKEVLASVRARHL